MKIVLISFDFWHYDSYIVNKLRQLGIDAHHINIGALQHENFSAKIINAFSKAFLNKNLKYNKRQAFVKESLRKLGNQDQILILNPDTLDSETIAFAKQYSKKLITYLYDNLERYPVQEKLHFFDKIYSFDDQDVEKHGFEKLTNYNYLDKNIPIPKNPENDIYYITSFDKSRNRILIPLAKKLIKEKIKFKFLVAGKKTWKEHLKFLKKDQLKNFVVLKRTNISPKKTLEEYAKSKAILDLMRSGQTGLSFRIFEAMALKKKIISNNPNLKNYDFYNPENILILKEDFSNLNKSFFESDYQDLNPEIYQKYTLEHWVKKVFNI